MQIGDQKFNMKTDGFRRGTRYRVLSPGGQPLVRHQIQDIAHHIQEAGQFRRIPGVYLPYWLPDGATGDRPDKRAASFGERIDILNEYFGSIIKAYRVPGSRYGLYRRYWSTATGRMILKPWRSSRSSTRYPHGPYIVISKVQQASAARKFCRYYVYARPYSSWPPTPKGFRYDKYGYYDYSHFCKAPKAVLTKDALDGIQPHLLLLKR